MKIETYLSPNCSEATFAIVNWNKHTLETFNESNENADTENIMSFLNLCWDSLSNGDDVVLTEDNGNGFHPDMMDAIKAIWKPDTKFKITDEKAMSDELCADSGNNVEQIIRKYMKSKVELLAEGYYGGKRRRKK